jgi:GMP synthase (glutamine-hydrolysing)
VQDFIENEIQKTRQQVGDEQVLLGLSGGVDSSVCAAILDRAIGRQLICIFVDHGFMRKNEPEEIEAAFSRRDLRFVKVGAAERFLGKVAGVADPEQKRKIIGAEFVRVFEEEAEKFSNVKFLAQGTIYPDVVESGAGSSANVKSHHNVGGLPAQMGFKGLVEPLRSLYKDDVRKLGRYLGLPAPITERQPFPGPGLAIRVIGEITKEKLDLLREADYIFRSEVISSGEKADQYFAVLTDLRSVGVTADSRTYDYTIALRAVVTKDFMTGEYAKLSHGLLEKAAARITGEVKGINRVVYDITNKPPATIEWE